MAVVRYGCETVGCGQSVANADIKLCDSCQAREDGLRDCPLCGSRFDASWSDTPDTAVCCSSRVMVAFYRGRPLNDREIAWAYDNHATADDEQREIAGLLARDFRTGDESFSGTHEIPHCTRWETPCGVEVKVEFRNPWTRDVEERPVESITIGGQYRGLTVEEVMDILERIGVRD